MFLRILFILFSLFTVSCGRAQKESPVVYISNASVRPIQDIKYDWAGNHSLQLPVLNPGESRSQAFYIKKNADFFGTIKISWVNHSKERISKEINFYAKNLPSIDDKTTYNYVQFYLDQDDMEILTSDAPDLSSKTPKMERLLTKYHNLYLQLQRGNYTQTQGVLIDVKPIKDRSLPSWLANSY
jgi:hypothetical protein